MKIQMTKEEINADNQIKNWQKVTKIAKKINNKKELKNAQTQIILWQYYFFELAGINIKFKL